MTLFLLQWHFSDGYDHSDGVLGVHSTEKSAEEAGNSWLADETSFEYYTFTITEMELNA